MSQLEGADARLLTSEYWSGFNIIDDGMFTDIQNSPPYRSFTRKERRFISESLKYALGQVVMGNVTEVQFPAGTEFESDLPDGSVVAMEEETLMRYEYSDPGKLMIGDTSSHHADPPINRPYASYWLNNQGGECDGETRIRYPENGILYNHALKWGVFITSHGTRYIQPVGFSDTKLEKDGTIDIYTQFEPRLTLPLPIGSVEPEPSCRIESVKVDTLHRVNGIDIVYPALGSKVKGPERARRKGVRLPIFSPQPF